MYIVVKYKIHLYSLRNRYEKLTRRLAILPVSKARTNKFYIYRQCTYIVYIHVHNVCFQFIDINYLSLFIFEVNYRYSKRWHLFVCFFVFFLFLMKKIYRRLINFQPVYFWGKLFIPTLICVSLSLSLCIIKKIYSFLGVY